MSKSFLCAVALIVALPISASTRPICGDVNQSGSGPNVSDITTLVDYLFRGTPALPYYAPADLDGQYGVTVTDLSLLVDFLFRGGSPPFCPMLDATDAGSGCISWLRDGGDLPYAQKAECLDEVPADSTEYMWVEMIGNDLYIHHINARYQCCLEYAVDFVVQDHNITACEHDTSAVPCPCECYFNLVSVFPGLEIMEPAEYVVTLVSIFGDTVGVDTLVVGEEYMALEVDGNDLFVYHMSALANCCPEWMTELFVEEDRIVLIEWDLFYGCDCMCYFNLKNTVVDLPPGEYTVTLIGVCNWPCGGCDMVDTRTVVIGGGP